MTTDVAVPQQTQITTGSTLGGTISVADVEAWVARANGYRGLANQLVRSFFVPAAYKVQLSPRATPEEVANAYAVAEANATGAMMLGGAIGLDPLTSLQNIYVVHGRPGMYTKLKVALAQASGHEVWDEVYSAERAVVCGRRRGSDAVVRIEITMQDAERAGWPSQNANYKKTPADMLWSRAAARVVDRIASDVLHGIASIEDIETEPAQVAAAVDVTTPAARATTAAILAAAGQQQDGVDPDVRAAQDFAATDRPESTAPAPVERAVLPITDPQMRMLGAVMAQLGVTGAGVRERRLTIASRIVDRPLQSSKELTKDEASTVIDTLTSILNNPDGPRLLQELENGEQEPAQDAASVVLDTDDYDPTGDAGWPMDGAEAAAEGGQP